jgi:hypothetical protein
LISFFIGIAVVALFTPLAVAAVRFAKRQRGGAVLLTGLLLVFGMNMQIIPPPPPRIELVQRQAGDDDPKV